MSADSKNSDKKWSFHLSQRKPHPTKFSKEITKATKGSDILDYKLRALRGLRGEISGFPFGCGSAVLDFLPCSASSFFPPGLRQISSRLFPSIPRWRPTPRETRSSIHRDGMRRLARATENHARWAE